MKGNVALIFIYNHRFDKNIEVLEKIYNVRFSNIFHLVPFYDGNKSNVIPVYENSFYFQGYIAQGFKQYFNKEFDHYIFIGDDLFINPNINEENYQLFFKLNNNDNFIPEIFNLHNFTNNKTLPFRTFKNPLSGKQKLYWWRNKELVKYKHKNEGLENSRELPTIQEAYDKLKEHGYLVKPLYFNDVYGMFPTSFTSKEKLRHARDYISGIKNYFKTYNLAYPLVASYSDITIVSKYSITKFSHYCGVFATNRLFVESALPTALLLASDNIKTQKDIGKTSKTFWPYTKKEIKELSEFENKYNNSLEELTNSFTDNLLFIHPIKLSKWK